MTGILRDSEQDGNDESQANGYETPIDDWESQLPEPGSLEDISHQGP
jgi:hypothetical protein